MSLYSNMQHDISGSLLQVLWLRTLGDTSEVASMKRFRSELEPFAPCSVRSGHCMKFILRPFPWRLKGGYPTAPLPNVYHPKMLQSSEQLDTASLGQFALFTKSSLLQVAFFVADPPRPTCSNPCAGL